MTIKVGLVDDKAINRNTICEKITNLSGIDCSFIAVNGHDCLEQLKGLPLAKHPQLIFMDIEMPGIDGIQTVSIAKPLYPDIRFVMLTIFDDDDKIFEAIKAGADGYLLKDESAEGLHQSIISAVENGGAPMSAGIARKTLEMLSKASMPVLEKPVKQEVIDVLLTVREKEILHHTIKGYDAKRVAEVTGISVLTVRKHVANIYQKLHVNSRAQALRFAYSKGLV